ncbi:hypothetical protein [Sulfitobacter aestuariivivens]|uniref:DUF995 domain-containing protein n=1 Tax=Sulfitobacter aestuariivivens TaxID=2766981 RepID=A0A927D5S3_9RHOB|nr:hypothetical protein [Sulfitobacter aestuariivivens]MBD3663762.1 hypothetical protein [Sulfitobacter aestuariivivens]
MRALFVALVALAAPVLAEPLDTEEKFEAYVGGRTMFFHLGDGRIYASESYLEDRKVRWSRAPGDCLDGDWYEDDGLICFVYENNPEPQCWSVELTRGGLKATSVRGLTPLTIFEAGDGEPQECLGPKVGV